jgi:hypothetical protein
LENETAALAQADDLLHPLRVLFPSHVMRYLTTNAADETDFCLIVTLLSRHYSVTGGTCARTSHFQNIRRTLNGIVLTLRSAEFKIAG